MRTIISAVCSTLALSAAPASAQTASSELIVRPGEPVAATIEGKPARLLVGSGRIDRLALDADYVAANGIKPALIMGRAEMTVAGRREFKGRNRPLTFVVAGMTRNARAFWFDGAPDSGVDGRIGPFGLPQDRVSFVLGPTNPRHAVERAPLSGDVNGSGFVGFGLGERGIAVFFDVESAEQYPIASAAAGALLARTFDGTVSGASWDVEVLMGVRRPVRLLTLARPLVIGPLSYSKIAVRVRDRIDHSGRGVGIPEAGATVDPDEVTVVAGMTGPTPAFGLTIPRPALGTCSRLTYDKPARKLELACAPLA